MTNFVARLNQVSLRYGDKQALDNITLDLPAGCIVGVIGPDGVGKSSLFALIAGAKIIQNGTISVLAGDMANPRHRRKVCPRIAYVPQGLGKHLYPTLSVLENLDFFARLFGHEHHERQQRIAELLHATGLKPFKDRAAGKLSGGMKQKLGLCCALIHDPDLLILDEPTTGVDPLSRRQFWQLIDQLRAQNPNMSVLVATAYMEEADSFDWLVAMNQGRVLATGTPESIRKRTNSSTLEQAFIAMLPMSKQRYNPPLKIHPNLLASMTDIAIEASNMTMRFGDFTAVDCVSFTIRRGEIFGFIGSNGCGKTTTMKMITGLLEATAGKAKLFGRIINPNDLSTRHRVGYMTQSFSLYSDLSVRQNLVLHARLFGITEKGIDPRVEEMVERFNLRALIDALPEKMSLGERQRLSLAIAMIHAPEVLILDEPTSGVDLIERDNFWRTLLALAREDNVTIFISTHFMNEAQRCDRVALMHDGKVLVCDTPAAIMAERHTDSLEAAFISHLQTFVVADATSDNKQKVRTKPLHAKLKADNRRRFSLGRLFSYSRRETLELVRDPIRLIMAALGSAVLMVVLGYGISMDVENLNFAVLDYDQTTLSRDYTLNLGGSRYFEEQTPLTNYTDMDKRLKSGQISLAIEIPPGFARNLARGNTVEIGAWIDGAMPSRAETVRGYVQGIHQHWIATKARESGKSDLLGGLINIETRFRYNPDVTSLPAMVPAVIPLLLILIPAILAALSVVREKELGSIVNLYVTPVTRLEFLVGKQLPYIALAMVSFFLLTVLAIYAFGVPFTGSFLTLSAAALIYVTAATAFGLLVSTFVRSQLAALFGTALLTMLPAVTFSGLINPVTTLEGLGRVIGELYPTTHFITIARGTFSKGLGFTELQSAFLPMLLAVPVLIVLATVLLKKQAR